MQLQKLIIVFIFSGLLICGCKEKVPDRALVVSKLKNSAKLATVEYVVTKVVSAEKRRLIFKDAYFFAETEATIKAGIDLDKLKEEDIVIKGTKINLTLPPIEIVNFSYPASAFKVIDSYTYGSSMPIWNGFTLKQRDELFRQGEEDIRSNIKNLGITKTAQDNTILLLTPILESAGFEEIYIYFKEETDTSLTNQVKTLREEIKALKEKTKK